MFAMFLEDNVCNVSFNAMYLVYDKKYKWAKLEDKIAMIIFQGES